MYAIILSIVCVSCLTGVFGYVFFSKVKTKASDNSVFLNSDVTWSGIDAEEIYESLKKAPIKATFKGDHKY